MGLRIVIIGGVAGGMSAATRARRMNEDASIIVLEKNGYVSFANCGLPYRVAGRIASDDKLQVTTAAAVQKRYNIDARVHHEAVKIDRAAREVEVMDHERGRTYRLPYDKLILAPGAAPIVPPIEHVNAPNVMPMRSMEDTFGLQRWLAQKAPSTAAVIGAGFIGVEMAEALHDRGIATVLVEKASHVLPPLDEDVATWVTPELQRHGVKLITGTGLRALHADAAGLVNQVELEDGRRIDADLVVLSIGVRPNVALARSAGLTIGAAGGIAVDPYQRTDDPDIYAVGDASESVHGVTGRTARIPLAGPANRQGRLAGEHAATGSSAPAGKVLGTAIVGIFGLAVGSTGLSLSAAKAAGFDADFAYVTANHHAGYYPGAKPIRIKLVYDNGTGRILGAQAVGEAGVDKRLDVIATAMHFGGTIDDLAALDLAYAPQFGSAKDPIHIAAMVAQNQRRRTMPAISADGLDHPVLLDVRTAQEHAAGTLPGAVHIPVDELRQRLGEIDPQKPTVVFCKIGLRGYVAQRILAQRGVKDVRNLKGGYDLASRIRR